MCAIHGIFKRDVDNILKMIEKANHRGPDGRGSWHDEHLTLGHNLLSIVDEEENSIQPWEHNNIILVFNGEIYNYKELGLEFNLKTNTDTEVIAHGIEKYGVDFLDRLDGMFGLAIYYKDSKQLTLARDSNGTKPVYYGFKNNTLCFSSEVKSLLEIGFQRKICKEALKHYYKQGYNSGYLTLFEGIQKLVPGEIRTYDVIEGNVIYKRNLNDRRIELTKDLSNLEEKIRDKINQSVKMTLMGRRKIGLFLSGGMDSTSILYEMTRLNIEPYTFTSNFATTVPGSNLNEDSNVAKQYCDELNVENFRLHQNESDFCKAMDDTFYALEEPRQGKSFPTYYNTNKFMAQHNITVTLSGDGGDEIFTGYKHHGMANWKTKLNSLGMNHSGLKNSELQINLEGQMDYLNDWLPRGGLQGDDINDMMYIECMNTLAEDFLIRNDKLGMNFSMEARFPLMCNILRDFVRSIPSELKVISRPGKKKGKIAYAFKELFKNAYRGRLPTYITDKKKTGWRFPTDEILIGNQMTPGRNDSVLRNYIIDTLKNKEIREIFELDDDKINSFLDNENFEPKPNSKFPPALTKQKELFTILNFAVWKKVFKMSI